MKRPPLRHRDGADADDEPAPFPLALLQRHANSGLPFDALYELSRRKQPRVDVMRLEAPPMPPSRPRAVPEPVAAPPSTEPRVFWDKSLPTRHIPALYVTSLVAPAEEPMEPAPPRRMYPPSSGESATASSEADTASMGSGAYDEGPTDGTNAFENLNRPDRYMPREAVEASARAARRAAAMDALRYYKDVRPLHRRRLELEGEPEPDAVLDEDLARAERAVSVYIASGRWDAGRVKHSPWLDEPWPKPTGAASGSR